MAGALERAGLLGEALALETSALRAFRRHKAQLWEARARNNRAIVLGELGRLREADAELDRADALYADLAMPLGRLKIRNNKAWIAGLRGDFTAAMRLHEGLQREFDALGVPAGHVLLDHAATLLAAQLPSEALLMASSAADQFASEGMELDRAEALLVASFAARHAGDQIAAGRYAGQAFDAFRSQGHAAWSLRARHAAIDASWQAGDVDGAVESEAASVADALADAGWREWAGELHLVAGHLALAAATPQRRVIALIGRVGPCADSRAP